MPCHGSYYNTEILRLVIDGYPTVLIDKKLDGISLDSVRTDNVQSMSRLVRYFAETGKKKIGFITVEETGTFSLGERNEGFYQGISEYGMTPVGKCSAPDILPMIIRWKSAERSIENRLQSMLRDTARNSKVSYVVSTVLPWRQRLFWKQKR